MQLRSDGMPTKIVLLASLTAAAVLLAGCFGGSPPAQARLVLGTTTSVNDSGLLNYILPDFESKSHAKVAVVAVGTGQALELGKRGDADVLVVHSPSQETAYLANGSGVARWQIMYNYFAIVGPATDPAGVKNASNATDAFARIAANMSVFISRGDGSGTNTKEIQIWTALGMNTSALPASWYKSIGQGMSATLHMAYQLGGYTLTDEGTYWSQTDIGANVTNGLLILRGGLAQPTSDLKNTYSVIQLNVTRVPGINATAATAFATWITSKETAALIGSYKVEGHQLFFPDPKRM
jgi:tungstate transport system substrate-binding protein